MIPKRNFPSLILAACAAALALAGATQAFAKSGQFSFVTGIVTVESRGGGASRQATSGMAVTQGDVITTGPTGMAQLTMNDQARLSLRSNSRMIVQVYPEAAAHQGAVVELTRGTLRAFTKLLSSNKDNYKMRTRVATVGIRGSDNLMNQSDDGNTTTNYTIDGSHEVSSNLGNFAPIITNPNQTVLVVQGQAPRIIPTPPNLLEAAKVMVGTGSSNTSQQGDGSGSGPAQGNLTGGPAPVVGGNGLGYTLVDASANLIGDPINLQSIVVATNGTAFSAEAVPGQIVLENGALRGYTSYAGSQGTTQLSILGGAATDVSTITIGASTTIVLGRFTNHTGIAFTGTGLSPSGSAHFGYANAGFPAYLSDVLTGTVSYTRAGATTPTNQFGTLGTLTSAVLDVNFTARTLNASVGITLPQAGSNSGGSWTLTATNVPFAFNSFVAFSGGGRLTVSNGNGQNSNTNSGLNGWLEGSFVGATLNGALFGYGITDQTGSSSNHQSINGMVAFSGPSQNAATAYREGLVSDPRGVLDVASYIRSFATTNRPEEVTVGANGAVSAFTAPYVGGNQLVGHTPYQQGTATIAESGADPTTGLVWGRWSGGTATIGGTQHALGNTSLHYVFGPVQAGPVSLPLTGTGVYDVVGSTRPSDAQGNLGTLGSATLNANFSARTVDASVTVGINNQTWNGTANGVPIYRDQYFFAAAGNRIAGVPGPAVFNITCTPNCTPQFQRGSLDGFFTGRTGSGAGMMYNMNGISGAVALARRGG
ncbi:MAG: FecR domain-containing protein [Betaproteobacteria bacterium]|nr:FecR domain-containing protein [Betaproteobacteria bacterium]